MKHTIIPLNESVVVTAAQMSAIEQRLFDAGMPVAALMEKVAGLITQKVMQLYPQAQKFGFLVGPGHNGGDALVVARELHLRGYAVRVCRPLEKWKDLTASHGQYCLSLGIPFAKEVDSLGDCDVIVDGLFGFGLTRDLKGDVAQVVETLNSWQQAVVSIDLPSGIHTDTGAVLGTAIQASQTLCLGLWKRAFFQERALAYLGKATRIDFGIQPDDIKAILGKNAEIQQLTKDKVQLCLPLPRPAMTHKYKQGHLLLVVGSTRYAGGAILAALGARASGVGMLSIAVPESLKPLLVSQLPEALVYGCPETQKGAIALLPELLLDLSAFDVMATGCGLTTEARPIVEQLLKADVPLVLDADGLNILAQLDPIKTLAARSAPTILTPHVGEFKRLFPDISPDDGIEAAQKAACQANAIILLKGARSAIAHPNGTVWLIPESTPALARGGSGDVLTGLLGGLICASNRTAYPLEATVATAAWWHAQAGILAAQERTELGVDAYTLTQFLIPAISCLTA
ncbi:MAG: NAD(P)H-hydrate dehydratase [Jaaginema sp. PMC 1079.18]|nr:NAD(P)H-hydrate dehydratase [Jaaginema sp. PMC 1080.18]MEC4852106.1 NAD(P)H-hydrate dehydratase [Jaaginema sp. PMC 1079.18]MEC4869121.1 NAD(P)H-hydrate dehydratase [Jaaginema sp. PMC 1078.18]